MTNRREFLHAAALAAVPIPVLADADERARRASRSIAANPALHAFLFDARHEESRIAGTGLARAGAMVRAIADGDVTRVWLRDIRPVWQDRPAALGGLTERAALFCLEQLGWAAGLRVAFHVEHRVYPDGHTEHALLRGTESAGLSARDLERAGPRWPTLVAAATVACAGPSPHACHGPSIAALAPELPPGARLLTSWTLAPV
ncbi:MAG: hypothetical protein ACREUG_04110 [Steroidobacteraceae bacterium]